MPRIGSAQEWMQRAISVWSDIQKTADELHLEHPAPYPVTLAARILKCYLDAGPGVVLDPFLASGPHPLPPRRAAAGRRSCRHGAHPRVPPRVPAGGIRGHRGHLAALLERLEEAA
jgi:hypothetical protein